MASLGHNEVTAAYPVHSELDDSTGVVILCDGNGSDILRFLHTGACVLYGHHTNQLGVGDVHEERLCHLRNVVLGERAKKYARLLRVILYICSRTFLQNTTPQSNFNTCHAEFILGNIKYIFALAFISQY